MVQRSLALLVAVAALAAVQTALAFDNKVYL